LDDFDTIKVCTGYETDGKTIDYFPFELNDNVKPVYIELPGWKTSLAGIKNENDFPPELKSYINFIEQQIKIPVSIASVGPNREQTIFLNQD
jgi:adenylosuccinate synthase